MMNSFFLKSFFWIFFVFTTVHARSCTEDDYAATYTECRENLRNLIWYIKEGVDCTGGVSKPENKYRLRCDIACGEGEYLPYGAPDESYCTPCPEGTYGLGGGYREENWGPRWKNKFFKFETYCTNHEEMILLNSDCQGWNNTAGVIWSGQGTDNNQVSVLELTVQLITKGHIHFEYRVSSEAKYDGLYFSVDGTNVLEAFEPTIGYKEFEMDLAQGIHTFMWKYWKDFSISQGDDAAFLKMVEIGGITYADSSCIPCPPTTFNVGEGNEFCSLCPENTYSNTSATKGTCTPCPASQYSSPGSSTCEDRPPCTPQDVTVLYTPCSSPGQRVKYYDFIHPITCDYQNYQLPQNQTVECVPCNPGTYRTENFECKYCPEGYYSGENENNCHECGEGSAALKGLYLNYFESLPENSQTTCDGCASGGWRAMGDFIDSGVGEGYWESLFSLNVELEHPGKITFVTHFHCQFYCNLVFNDGNEDYFVIEGETTIELLPGNITLTWSFSRAISYSYDSKVNISSIEIEGVKYGGAKDCHVCPKGTFSEGLSSSCELCDVGYSSSNGSKECFLCPENTFSEYQGAECISCGPGTESEPGSSHCDNPCSFSLEGLDTTFDLTPLIRQDPDDMYGPVESGDFSYRINVCGPTVTNKTCYGWDGESLNTYACQTYKDLGGYDIGRVIGYYPYTPSPRDGLVITFTQGDDEACPYPRTTNLTMLCDPSQGIGHFEEEVLDDPICTYKFIWRSLYACPLCNEKDWSYSFSECDQDGYQNKTYYWIHNPKRCHDGKELPKSERVPCFKPTIECPPGQKAVPDSDQCTDCGQGFYSLGGALEYNNWSSLPSGFINNGWILEDHIIKSGQRNTSLVFTDEFTREGSVAFTFKLHTNPSEASPFTFYIDGEKIGEWNQLMLDFQFYAHTKGLEAGTHTIKWEFTQTQPQYHAVIKSITINGTRLASTQCTPCPPGRYASSTQSNYCQICEENTFSTGAASSCAACNEGEFSLEGSDVCKPLPYCTSEHYQEYFTPCVDGQRSSYFVKLYPCKNDTLPSNRTGLPCADCPLGTFQENNACKTCEKGYYYDGNECKMVPAGSIAKHFTRYFFDNSQSVLGSEWKTGCSGSCGSDGWRMRGNYIDSGEHSFDADQDVDSYVSLVVEMAVDGEVQFTFEQKPFVPNTNEFEFFIDEVPIPLNNPLNFGVLNTPLKKGTHQLLWNFHQDSQAPRTRMIIRNLTINGTATGATVPVLCPAGTYSLAGSETCSPCTPGHFSKQGAPSCSPCPINYFQSKSNQDTCEKCGQGTFTEKTGQTKCITSCVFNVSSEENPLSSEAITYDLTGLNKEYGPINFGQGSLFLYLCSSSACGDTESSICLEGTDFGKNLQFSPKEKGFSLVYSNGDEEGCKGHSRASNIRFLCNANAGEGAPIIDYIEDSCSLQIIWSSIYGCPLCKMNDYEKVYSECENGKKAFKYIVKDGIECHNTKPPIGGSESCSEASGGGGFPVIVVVIIVIITLALAGVAIWLGVKNRRIQHRYKKLREDTMELDETKSETQFTIE